MAEGFLGRVRIAVEGLTPGYVALVALTGWRLVAYREEMVGDFTSPRRGFGFFTFVAGTNVLGVRLGLAGSYEATATLFVVAWVAWLALGYVVPWTAVLGRQERPVVATANGTWFIWVVAGQSVAVAAATIEPVFHAVRRELAVLAITSWSVGVFLYGAVGLLVALRLMLYEFGPEELTPPYWIAMGALAITVLAGARIVEMADAPMVAVTRDLIAGLAVVFWAFASWLIPVLVAAGWWRHVRRRVPLRYEATLWSIVFPLGMYAVAGIYLGRADGLPVVEAVGSIELWVAFAAWALVFVAMVAHVMSTGAPRTSSSSALMWTMSNRAAPGARSRSRSRSLLSRPSPRAALPKISGVVAPCRRRTPSKSWRCSTTRRPVGPINGRRFGTVVDTRKS